MNLEPTVPQIISWIIKDVVQRTKAFIKSLQKSLRSFWDYEIKHHGLGKILQDIDGFLTRFRTGEPRPIEKKNVCDNYANSQFKKV
jgi:hypothetical protein